MTTTPAPAGRKPVLRIDEPFLAEPTHEETSRHRAYRFTLAAIRLSIGWVFVWAFLDKMFGLGHETPSSGAWIDGGSPTAGHPGLARRRVAPDRDDGRSLPAVPRHDAGQPRAHDRYGHHRSPAIDGFVAAVQLYLAVIAAGYVVQAIGTLRAEEAAGRLEPRLCGTLSRARWLASHLLVVLGGLVTIVLGSLLVLGLATALAVGDRGEIGPTLRSGLAYLPAELVLAGWRWRSTDYVLGSSESRGAATP